ncbi:MAG: DUF111 family protein, partial [Oscillospiraceae bacterium]|nr:DUF111 family protein [Oscillospiraceae bacterium]
MKILYLDCGMGAAGDMLTASLLELFENPQAVLAELNGLGIPGVQFLAEKSVKCGVTGTHVRVLVAGEEEAARNHHHHHSGMADIAHIVGHLHVSEKIRKQILD